MPPACGGRLATFALATPQSSDDCGLASNLSAFKPFERSILTPSIVQGMLNVVNLTVVHNFRPDSVRDPQHAVGLPTFCAVNHQAL
jgi:hypothetical protein